MQQLFHRLARSLGIVRDPADPAGSAERPLRILLAASVALPIALLAVASWISYRQHHEDAHDRLQRNLAIVQEHAQKVFETFEFSARYLDEMLDDAGSEQIRANEAMYSERLRAMTNSLPQLRDIWIVDADGHPVVSGTIFPMPRIDLSDRDYFRVHKNGLAEGPYVSSVLAARAANTEFFAISRKRTINGRFAGVTVMSISPDYFTEFYATLPQPIVAGLVRADGVVLARYPDGSMIRQLPPDAPF